MTDNHSARFKVAPRVIHETIDGEVIIIDLGTGSYYSLRGSGADVWQLIHGSPGVASAELVDALTAHYEVGDVEIGTAVSAFVDKLSAEGLVTPADANDLPGALSVPESNGSPPRAFEAPTLEKYTDMQDLVLLDPVHEVGEIGWPQVPTDAATSSSSG